MLIKNQRLEQEIQTVVTLSSFFDAGKRVAFLSSGDRFHRTINLNDTEGLLCRNVSRLPMGGAYHKYGIYLRKGSKYQEGFNQGFVSVLGNGAQQHKRIPFFAGFNE